jgi:hypothetical protein
MLNRHKIVSLNDTFYFLKDFFEKCKQKPQVAVGNSGMKVKLIFFRHISFKNIHFYSSVFLSASQEAGTGRHKMEQSLLRFVTPVESFWHR